MPLINKRIVFTTVLGALFSCSVLAESLFSAVHIQTLPNLGIDNLGIENNVPADIWGKSNPQALQSLVREITAKPLTPAMREIIAQMMIRQTPQNTSLPLIFRMETLMKLGRFDSVLTLADLVPPTHQTPDILRLKALALFLSSKTKSACEFMAKMPTLTQMDEEMRLACAVANGDKTGAELIFATRMENNELDETTAILAKKIFLNDDISLEGKEIKEHHLPLLEAVGNKIDWSKITVPAEYQKTVSDLSGIPLHIRLVMAEKYHPDRLDELYMKTDDKTVQNNAVMRAKLYQRMHKKQEDTALASIINEYLETAKADGLFLNLAPVMRPVLDTITPSENMTELAFNAVQVYALSNNADLAYAWYQILQKSTDETSKINDIFLEPLIHQVGGGLPKNIDKGLAFCQKNKHASCSMYWDKIGFEADTLDWAEVLSYLPTTQGYLPLVQEALRQLIASGHQGEAILYAVKLWQNGQKTEPYMIKALSEISPKSLVRQLILERYVYP